MKIILVMGSILAPLSMFLLQRKWPKLRLIFNAIAVLSALILGNISSIAIYEIIKNETVFMTNIHALFLNPFFLLTGSYLGVYFLYRLFRFTLDDRCNCPTENKKVNHP